MKIPKAITIGKTRFTINKVKALDRPPAHGRISFIDNTIRLASHSIHHTPYRHAQKVETFWHETLHACLCDMGKPLCIHDEKFVDALAVRLAQVCLTAEV